MVSRMVIRTLAEAGYSLTIFSLLETDHWINQAYTGEATVEYQVFRNNKIAFTLAIWHALFCEHYDLVICEHINLASILFPFKIIFRGKYVVWLYGSEVFSPRPDFEGRLGVSMAWKRLAISDFTRQAFNKRYPKQAVITCELALDPVSYPVELSSISETVHKISMRSINGRLQELSSRVILFVGRMDPYGRYKGQDKLIVAFHMVQSRFPEAQLVLAGSGDDYEYYRMMAKAQPQSTHSAIFLPGQVSLDLLHQLYRACYLFAMPSLGEGFGLVYLEAMSYAKPCVGCRDDAASCVIQHGVTGLLVESPVTVERVAEACIELLAHPDMAKQMGLAGSGLLRNRYLFQHFRERFWDAINK